MTPDRAPVIDLPYTKRTLDNGLDVIVHEDHHVPIVAVNLWYHVGSKNEQPGRTGFAHLFEHLMFEGSEHQNSGYFAPLQAAGGQLNGSTNADRTNYWEVVPTNAVDLALWMESDRMAYLLPALTKERFETQRDVVLNERRQNYENRPYGLALMAIVASIFPPDHPYNWMTIGSADDIRAMEFEDVREFFRTYYRPANASLVLAGDLATDRAFELADRYFGDIPAGPRPEPVTAVATLEGERRLVLEDRVERPRIYMAWLTPAMYAPGDAELDLCGDLLANGKTARLYRTLVYERRVALDVSAAQQSREIAGYFVLAVTAAPGASLADLAAAVDEEIARLVAEGPTSAEMERAEAQAEATFVYHLQTVGGFDGKSDQLNAYNVMRGDPGFFARDLDRYRLATPESVRDAAQRYLRPDRRVILSVVPRGQAAGALAGSEPVVVS
jgi:zinc protease